MSAAKERAALALAELRAYGHAGPFPGARLVGPAWFHVGRSNARLVIYGLWVSEDARGEGKGSELLRRVLRHADAHCVAVELRVRPFAGGTQWQADELREWYARHGFERCGVRSAYMRRPAVERGHDGL